MTTEVTFLGTVIRVQSGVVEIELSEEIPSTTPIINGRLYKIGQIGTFVKIPIGNISIYGIVASVSNMPSKIEGDQSFKFNGSRYISVQLIGEKIGNDDFQKGIGTFPTINDEVHIVTELDLIDIYGKKNSGSIEIGKHSSSDSLNVFMDVHKLILRHSAILGSTGSGKSNTTVCLLKAILNEYIGSRVILVDPHGEYASAFPEANIFKINDKDNPLHIPYWLMNFEELAFFLVGAKPTDDQKVEYRKLRELVTEYKRSNCERLSSGIVRPELVTADSPIPFNLRELWFKISWWMNASFSELYIEKQTLETAKVVKEGNADELISTIFEPYSLGSAAPFKSKHFQEFFSYEKKLLSRLRDSRFDFLFNPGEYRDASTKDLHQLLNTWIGTEKRLTILDLSGVPYEVLDITVGLIARFIYESMFWGRHEEYTGKKRPLLIAFEEAHSYLRKEQMGYGRSAVERIFKEGRKFGVGALVISQRPSEISETILAQVGTFIALRLTNSGDQAIVKSSAPDNMNSLIDLLPSLRIGEAIVVGEAIKIPSRVRMKLNVPRPASDDPRLVESWNKEHPLNMENYKKVVLSLREQKL